VSDHDTFSGSILDRQWVSVSRLGMRRGLRHDFLPLLGRRAKLAADGDPFAASKADKS
jgi:hypothetical protein